MEDPRVQHRQWICMQLQTILGFSDVDGIADHILYAIGNRDELLAYCNEIVGDESPDFIDELANRLYQKKHHHSKKKQAEQHSNIQDPNRGKGLVIRKVQSNKPKKQNRNRTSCDCFGTQHEVFSNCLSCGRILCTVEGEGPCFFCGCFVHKDYTDSSATDAILRKEAILESQQKMTAAKVIDEQEPPIAGGFCSQPGAEHIVLDFNAIHGFANRSLSGQARELYDLIHASLEKNKG